MDVSKLNNLNSASAIAQLNQVNPAAKRPARDESESSAVQAPPGRRGGQFADAVAQTLGQLGFDVPVKKGGPVATASQSTDVQNAEASANQKEAAQAVQGFMANLFQALGGANAGPKPGDGNPGNAGGQPGQGGQPQPPVEKAYGDLENRLNNLIQSLENGSSPAQGGGNGSQLEQLSASFEKMTQALTTEKPAAQQESASQTDLQAFLKSLKQNMQSYGSALLSPGSNVDIFA